MQLRGIPVAAALALLDVGLACSQEAPWAQYRDLSSLEIPYANGPISAAQVPHIWLKLSGNR